VTAMPPATYAFDPGLTSRVTAYIRHARRYNNRVLRLEIRDAVMRIARDEGINFDRAADVLIVRLRQGEWAPRARKRGGTST